MKQKKNSLISRIKKPLIKKQTPDTNLESYRCPKCKHIITIESESTKNIFYTCPNCGKENIFTLPLKQSEKKHEEPHKIKSWLFQQSFNALIVALILTLVTTVFLFKQDPFTTKLSLSIIIIGIIVPLFMTEKKHNISIAITFGTIIFIIFLFLITGTDFEIFLLLIFIGVLTAKVVIDEYLPTTLKLRMNLFISAFFIIFIVIVIKRIINLVGI